jgi:Cellulase (glycosyl hydrolase family 5)
MKRIAELRSHRGHIGKGHSGYSSSTPTPETFNLGVNFSGLEDVALPLSLQEMQYFVTRGIKSFRLPVTWPQIQPTVFGPLNTSLYNNTNLTYLQTISAVLANAAAIGATVLIDSHNFGQGPDGTKVGSSTVPISAFTDYWNKFSAWLRADPNYQVIQGYDIMNEWNSMDPNSSLPSTSYSQNLIFQCNQNVVTALRAAGDRTKLYLEWDHFSGAWDAVANNIAMLMNINDPADNFIISVHGYMDNDASGTNFIWAQEIAKPGLAPPGLATNVNIGPQRLAAVVALANQMGVRLHVGETGWSNDNLAIGGNDDYSDWNTAGSNLLTFCKDNNIEIHIWGAGPGFPNLSYGYCPEPSNVNNPSIKDFTSAGLQSTQMVILDKFSGYTNPQPLAYRSDLPFNALPYTPNGTALNNFKIRYNGVIPETQSFTGSATLNDGTNVGGTFSNITIPPGNNGIATFSYTPSVADQAINLNFTNTAGLINPPAIGITSTTDFFNTTIGAIAPNIYSLRLLNTAYIGPAVRLQRITDGAQSDFHFNNAGNLPRQAIQDWSSSRTIQLITWYDQSGLGNHAVFNSTNINLILVDTDGYPSISTSGTIDFVSTPSTNQATMTTYAEVNPTTSVGIIATQDEFVESFRLSVGSFSVAKASVGYPVTLDMPTGTWNDVGATYSSLYGSNNLNSYKNGSLNHQATAAQFLNSSLAPVFNMFSFQFGGPAYNGKIRTLILHYLEYTPSNFSTLHSSYNTYYTTSLPDSLSALPPTIANVASSHVYTTTGTTTPFYPTVIIDGNSGATDTVTITLSGAAATLSGTGLSGSNPYTLSSDTPANLTTKLQALVLSSSASVGSVVTATILVTSSVGTTSTIAPTITVANYGIETAYTAPTGTFSPPNNSGINMDGDENFPSANPPHPFLINYYASKGFGCIRMPIGSSPWLNPTGTGQSPLNVSYITTTIKPLIDQFRSNNMTVILDLHQGSGLVAGIIPTSAVSACLCQSTEDCLIDFWSRVGSLFKNYDNIWIDILNEPTAGITVAAWAALVPRVCVALRNAGFTGKILIEGAATFSAASSWVSSGNGAAFASFAGDPGNNFAFSPHQYMDAANTGTNPVLISGSGSTLLSSVTSWATTNGFKLFLGETGFSPASWKPAVGNAMIFDSTQTSETTNGITEGTAILNYMKTHSGGSGPWLGYAIWASNNFPTGTPSNMNGCYAFTIDPPTDFNNGSGELTLPIVDRPQLAVITANLI